MSILTNYSDQAQPSSKDVGLTSVLFRADLFQMGLHGFLVLNSLKVFHLAVSKSCSPLTVVSVKQLHPDVVLP